MMKSKLNSVALSLLIAFGLWLYVVTSFPSKRRCLFLSPQGSCFGSCFPVCGTDCYHVRCVRLL